MKLLIRLLCAVTVLFLCYTAGSKLGAVGKAALQPPVAAKPAAVPSPIKPKLFSIVRLVSEDGQTFCSGTVVNPTTIITASHCVMDSIGMFVTEGPIEIRAVDNIKRGHDGHVVQVSRQMDTAVITGDFSRFQPRPYVANPATLTNIRNSSPSFISCGYPLHGDLYCTPSNYLRPVAFFWAIRGVLLPGMSGGPTMLLDGTVIGINVAVQDDFSIISPIYNLVPEKKK